MALEFEKLDETCSNVYLIDERLCLKNSYEIINTNVKTLSSNLQILNVYANDYNLLFLNFSQNSARWIRAIDNWQTLSAKWLDCETAVYNLSSNWIQQISLIYNKIIDFDYYAVPSNKIIVDNNIKNWIQTNFASNCPKDQIVNIDLYLSRNTPFTWSYITSYFEDCIPPNTSLQGDCNCPKPSYGCNYIWNTISGALLSRCNNVGNYCRYENKVAVGLDNVRCPTIGSTNVVLRSSISSTDKSIVRVVRLKYQKQNQTIVQIP